MTPIALSARAAADVRSLLEQSQRLQDTLRTYIEAAGAALDVPRDWRFDVTMLAFVPPAEQQPGQQVVQGDAQ